MSAFLVAVLFPGLLIYAAVRDAGSMTIPNWVSAAVAVGFLVLGPMLLPPATFGTHVLVGLAALAAAAGMFAMGWVGGGDAKLFAASALWIGAADFPLYIAAVALSGGALALALLGLRQLQPVAGAQAAWAARLLTKQEGIPYGIALAAGGLAVFPVSGVFRAALGG